MTVEAILGERDSRAVTVRGDASVALAISIMRTRRAGALVVSDDGRRIAGILAERDLIRAFRSLGSDRLERVMVTDIMRRGVQSCRPEDSLRQVMARMTARRIGHMPVVDGGGLRGVIGMTEIVARRLRQAEMAVEAVRGTPARRHACDGERRNTAADHKGRTGPRRGRIIEGEPARAGSVSGSCS